MHNLSVSAQRAIPSLADCTCKESIILRLTAQNSPAVVDKLIRILHVEERRREISDQALKVLRRELLTGLTLDLGAVVLVAREPGETRPRLALGRAVEPLPWRASHLKPVEFVFLLISPAHITPGQMPCEAALSRLCKDPARLQELRTAQSEEAIMATLVKVPLLADELRSELPPESRVSGKPAMRLRLAHDAGYPDFVKILENLRIIKCYQVCLDVRDLQHLGTTEFRILSSFAEWCRQHGGFLKLDNASASLAALIHGYDCDYLLPDRGRDQPPRQGMTQAVPVWRPQ